MEGLPHDLRAYDPELVAQVETMYQESDKVFHAIFTKIIEEIND